MATRVEIEIVPREQFRGYLTRKERFACIVAHRRGGKTFACIQDLIARSLTHRRAGPHLRYGYIAPTRDQAKDITWAYLKAFCADIPGVKVNEAQLAITMPNQAVIRLYSGDSYERMRGLYFDGVVIDEPADIDPDAWPFVVRPCLSDYLGWATFIGTPKGRNAFYERWVESTQSPDWYSMVLKASDSGLIPAAELASIRAGTPDHVFRQEYECDFTVPAPGAIFARELDRARAEGRICAMPVDGSNLVNTSWDLGAPANMAVWYWQLVGREIRFIDFDRGDKGTLTERVAYMLGKGYNYGKHYLPHDAEQTERTGSNFLTELAKAGLPANSLAVIPRVASVWIGINHALEMFPSLVFRSPQCDPGLDALAAYRKKTDGEGVTSTEEPIHDWASHPADAFRMMAEAHRAGLVKFKHTTAEVKASWYFPDLDRRTGRKGCKPIRVSA